MDKANGISPLGGGVKKLVGFYINVLHVDLASSSCVPSS